MTSPHNFTFSVRYDDDMLHDAVGTFIKRRAFAEQKMMWVIAALMAVFSIYFFLSGGGAVFAGVMLVLAVMPLICVAVFRRLLRTRLMARMRKSADITVDADRIDIVSDLGEGHILLRDVIEVWERPRTFMLFTDTTVFDILPRDGMPEPVQLALRARAAQIPVAQG